MENGLWAELFSCLLGAAFALQKTKGGFGLHNSMKNSVANARATSIDYLK